MFSQNLKNLKSVSDTKTNDDPITLAYYMAGSDKLLSDDEFSIQNVIVEKIEKVFKLVEMINWNLKNLPKKQEI
ncbi:hypothetical protein Hanom_Chr03g00216911 [Helianthus anomalus]